MNILFSTWLLPIAQADSEPVQSEYLAAIALTAAMVLLGLLVVCIPRKRAKHFIEPPGEEEKSKKKKKKRRR